MYPVGQEYLEAMNKTTRDSSQMEISLAVLNQEAEANAKVIGYSEPAPWSDVQGMFGKKRELEKREFATFEENYMRADGTQYIYDFNGNSAKADNNGGFESAWLSDSNCDLLRNGSYPYVEIDIGSSIDLDLFSLYFDIFNTGNVVTELELWGYTGTNIKTVQINNTDKVAQLEGLGFTKIDKIRIVMKKMNRPNARARLWEVKFGIIYVYTNNELLKVSPHDEIDPCSSKLPDQHITFAISNLDKKFNPENPQGLTNYLMENQQITAKIGINTVNGIEWIPIRKLLFI